MVIAVLWSIPLARLMLNQRELFMAVLGMLGFATFSSRFPAKHRLIELEQKSPRNLSGRIVKEPPKCPNESRPTIVPFEIR